MNVSKIINGALKQLGILAAGENAQAGEMADAIDSLRGLLSQWATMRLHVYKAQTLTLPLSRGAATYTIGKIEGECCQYEVTCKGSVIATPDLNAEIARVLDRAWLDGKEIQLIRDLNDSASNVRVWYQEDSPNWLFHVLDNASELKLKVFTLPYQICAHDELAMPPQYERALKLSLAVEIASMFGVEPTQLLLMNYRNAITLLKESNSTPLYVNNDLDIGGGYGCY